MITGASMEQNLEIKVARLWSVEDPFLYTLLSELLVDGVTVDSERTLLASAPSAWTPKTASA